MYGLLGLLSARLGWDSSAGELRRETETEGEEHKEEVGGERAMAQGERAGFDDKTL